MVNASEWFHFYGFDVMSDIAFGKSIEMMRDGKRHFILDLLHKGVWPLGLLGPIPWAFCILTSIPGLGRGFKTFVSWCTEQVENRRKVFFKLLSDCSRFTDTSICLDAARVSRCYVLAYRVKREAHESWKPTSRRRKGTSSWRHSADYYCWKVRGANF